MTCPKYPSYCNSSLHHISMVCHQHMSDYYGHSINGSKSFVCPQCETVEMMRYSEWYEFHKYHLGAFSKNKPKPAIIRYKMAPSNPQHNLQYILTRVITKKFDAAVQTAEIIHRDRSMQTDSTCFHENEAERVIRAMSPKLFRKLFPAKREAPKENMEDRHRMPAFKAANLAPHVEPYRVNVWTTGQPSQMDYQMNTEQISTLSKTSVRMTTTTQTTRPTTASIKPRSPKASSSRSSESSSDNSMPPRLVLRLKAKDYIPRLETITEEESERFEVDLDNKDNSLNSQNRFPRLSPTMFGCHDEWPSHVPTRICPIQPGHERYNRKKYSKWPKMPPLRKYRPTALN